MSFTFIHTADLHLSKNLRLEDFDHSLSQISDCAIEERVRFVLVAGDIYHRSSPDNQARVVFKKWVQKLISHNIPIFILLGTHDESHSGVHGLEDVNVYELQKIVVMDKPGIHGLKDGKREDVKILAIPSISPHKYKVKDITRFIIGEINRLKKELTKETYNILAGHFTVAGGSSSTGYSFTGSTDPVIPKEVIDNTFDYVALGHLHKFQILGDSPPTVYSGSIERINFGEREDEKGYIFVSGHNPVFRGLDARPMKQYETSGEVFPKVSKGEIVKVVVRVCREEVGGFDTKRLVDGLMKDGAKEVKVVFDVVDKEKPKKQIEERTWEQVFDRWVKERYPDKEEHVKEVFKEVVEA